MYIYIDVYIDVCVYSCDIVKYFGVEEHNCMGGWFPSPNRNLRSIQ